MLDAITKRNISGETNMPTNMQMIFLCSVLDGSMGVKSKWIIEQVGPSKFSDLFIQRAGPLEQ